MSLAAPQLDDRRFQDLVDDAKRLVQQHCPEWSDHNVSDPGVTLIELFAWMTDQLLYRLNRVPDLNYVKYLELLGVTLFPPTAAQTDLTFRLSAAREDVLLIPRGTQVSTVRIETDDEITFTTDEMLRIMPCRLRALASTDPKGKPRQPPRQAGRRRSHQMLQQGSETGRCVPHRPFEPRPVVHRRAAAQLPNRGCRRRPEKPPARVGGLDRDGLDRVRGRARRH